MGMTDKNLCDSCTNIGCEFQSGIVRTKCAFYMPPHIESDNCGNYVVMQPTVEAIPKDEYENRLKADMVAMLIELKNKLIDRSWNIDIYDDNLDFECCYLDDIDKLIQQKIDKYKAESEDKE